MDEREKLQEQILRALGIDEHFIELEKLKQAGKYYYWSMKAAWAENILLQLRAAMVEEEASLSRGYRKKFKKITDKAVKEWVAVQPSMKKLRAKVIDSQYTYTVLHKAEFAFAQRAKMLENLIPSHEEEFAAQMGEEVLEGKT